MGVRSSSEEEFSFFNRKMLPEFVEKDWDSEEKRSYLGLSIQPFMSIRRIQMFRIIEADENSGASIFHFNMAIFATKDSYDKPVPIILAIVPLMRVELIDYFEIQNIGLDDLKFADSFLKSRLAENSRNQTLQLSKNVLLHDRMSLECVACDLGEDLEFAIQNYQELKLEIHEKSAYQHFFEPITPPYDYYMHYLPSFNHLSPDSCLIGETFFYKCLKSGFQSDWEQQLICVLMGGILKYRIEARINYMAIYHISYHRKGAFDEERNYYFPHCVTPFPLFDANNVEN